MNIDLKKFLKYEGIAIIIPIIIFVFEKDLYNFRFNLGFALALGMIIYALKEYRDDKNEKN